MKNSKLALGIGIGAAVSAIAYLATTKEGKRLQRRASDAFNEAKSKMEGKYYEAKGKAKDAFYKAESKVENKMDKVKAELNQCTMK